MSSAESPDSRPAWRRLLIPALKVIIVVVIAWAVIEIVREVDWAQVGDSLSTLTLLQAGILTVLLLLRQFLNAVPLALFAAGLSVWRSTVSDLSANLVATVAPPPGDVVLRVAMFRSWKVALDTALAALSLNTLIYYILRFAAPVVGFLALLVAVRYDENYAVVALVSAAIAVLMALLIVLIVRSESSARWLGITCAKLVRRVRPKVADPQRWSDTMAKFRADVEQQMRREWAKALVALLAMVVVEAIMLFASMRFLGVDPDQLNGVEIVAAFLITYPLTALPFGGIGILDAALYGILTHVGTEVDGNAVIAALVVFRVFTLAVPLILGLITLLSWRRANPDFSFRQGLRGTGDSVTEQDDRTTDSASDEGGSAPGPET